MKKFNSEIKELILEPVFQKQWSVYLIVGKILSWDIITAILGAFIAYRKPEPAYCFLESLSKTSGVQCNFCKLL